MNNQLPKNINKYLNKFSSSKWKTYRTHSGKYKTIIVVPAISEYENLRILLNSLLQNDDKYFSGTLILFVINNLESTSEKIKLNNLKSIEFLKQQGTASQIDIDFIDASTKNNELDEKNGGVGLSRKIGMDLALALFDYNSTNQNLLVCLDADCTVEANYISTIRNYFNNNKVSAGYVNFKHMDVLDAENEKAIINYEIFLRYYVLGLIFAKSPYAYHSIGSTMVCDTNSYIKVQGMNKRKAAEDFYFMEKLSKITRIEKIDCTAVLPSSRGSWRVPFGTGQRVNRFLDKVQNEYILYSPKSFEVLKKWIELFYSDEVLNAENYLEQAKGISEALFQFLTKNNFKKNWDQILENSNSNLQINTQKLLWFDGFRTLKLIHYLRDVESPTINMFDALDELFSMMSISFSINNTLGGIPSIDIQKKYLEKLREIA
ncbi:MAG: hypothetical protein L3J41_07805 [Melioribacteraceae bacterium]|nr:hypothetical protein [Melioribacteraceae bacterium]